MPDKSESLTAAGLEFLRELIEILRRFCEQTYPSELETQVVHYHVTRAVGLLRGTECLVKSGLPREALVLCRSLLNLVINIAWLTAGYHPSRMKWFADCEILTIQKNLKKLLLIGHISQEQYEADVIIHQAEWDAFLDKYGYRWSGENPPREWAKSIKFLAYDLKEHPIWHMLWRDYESSYAYLSSEEHTDPRAALHHMDLESSDSAARPAGSEDEETLLIETCRYAIYVVIVANHFFSGSQDIKSLSDRLGKLHQMRSDTSHS